MVARLGSMRLPRSRILRRVFAAVGAGVLLAMLGPFGTYLNHGPVARVGYWIAAMLLGFVLYGGAFAAAGLVAPLGHRWRGLVLVGAALLASIPETAITRALAFRLWPELAALGLSWPLWFAQASLLGLMAVAIAERMRRCGAVPPGGGRPMSTAGGRPVPALPSDLLALQMEDHYVRVHTARGSDLILMPLVRAMDGVEKPGLRVHRSWWVARDAVVAVDGTPRAMRLRLSNGVVAPVARSAVVHLREAGWLSP
ncbi:LytTR family DNA-binding domain-containing protein [Methylobacterium goesingense]|uniref:HTH LytTR-type domain-containing protein n=1 Tax=Methylobacterium goesingense TaxID=243690 RepID=A0ABV2LDB3_9HYPH|nr:LytTR family DNA-binding domain-containing protein [Methylobacterium goesingense]GJD74148.1 hypothetical protein CFIICLFH_2382 [Methylobacterium goesingense]